MALVLANRVQETGTANTTVSFTLTGAVGGFQSFAAVGNTNTTYYAATDASGNWEVGLGTYATTGPTLTRTTVYASSNSGSAVTFSGTCNVFVTLPSGSAIYEDASGNASALGTITSGIWNASTIPVAYGGTGVTASSGATSVMLRDANQNVAVNRLNQSNTSTVSAAGTTALTAASSYSQTLTGTTTQTYTMPDATTLTTGVAFVFNNNSTGVLTLKDYAAATIGTITAGGAVELVLLANGTVAGTWDVHAYIPESVTWGTNALALGSTVITGGTWNGGTIPTGYGGTGLTTFTGANNALYSTSSSALAAGTLPVLAGGTGVTTSTGSGANVLATSPTLVTPVLGTPSSGTLTSCTGLPLTTGVTGTLPTANGGTGNINGTVATLTTARAIYGNNFDGSAALTQVIASTYGGTGNGFTKFSGPTTAEKTFTLPDASSTIVVQGGALGTPSSGVATNLTGTATSLNIGGNAATATTATTATTANALNSANNYSVTRLTATPNTVGVSTGITCVNGDITSYRTGGTTGVIYLSSSGSNYLYWDGANYNLNGGAVVASNIASNGNTTGASASCTGNAATATTATNQSGGTVSATTGSFSGLITGATCTTVDINSANDTGTLSVRGNSTYPAAMSFHRTGVYAINMGLSTSNTFVIGGWSASSNAFSMTGGGALTMLNNITAYSDETLKKNWRDLPIDFVERLAEIKHGIYDRIDQESTQVGVSAQSLQPLMPDAVMTQEDGKLSVAYGNAAMVSAVQLAKRVVEQEERIARLEAIVAKLTEE